MYVRYTESVRGADVFVLQSHCTPVNKSIMEQLIMIDALKRASAIRSPLYAHCLVIPVKTRSIVAANPSPAVLSSICCVLPAPIE